jgi:hypothetical protein
MDSPIVRQPESTPVTKHIHGSRVKRPTLPGFPSWDLGGHDASITTRCPTYKGGVEDQSITSGNYNKVSITGIVV